MVKIYDWEDGSAGHWDYTHISIQSNVVFAGSNAAEATSGSQILKHQFSGTYQPSELQAVFQETTDNGGYGFVIRDQNDDVVDAAGSSNPDIESDAVGEPSVTHDYGDWVRFRYHNIDWANSQFDIEIENITQSDTFTKTGVSFYEATGSDLGEIYVGDYNFDSQGSGGLTANECWVDNIHGPQSSAVDDLSASASTEDEIDLSWSTPPGGETTDTYNVYRAESSGSTLGDYTQIDSGVTGTSYTDTSLEDGEHYYYRIETVDAFGNTDTSNEAGATSILPASSISVAQTGSSEITVSWTKADDSSDGSWELFRSTDGSLGSSIFSTTTLSTTEYADSGVTTDTKYWYTLRRSTDHAQADSAQVAAGIPTAPTIDAVTVVNGDELDVQWQDNSTAEDGYRVSRRPTGTSGWTQDGGDLPANTTSHTTAALRDGEQYDVRVAAFIGGTGTDDTSSPAATTVLPDAQQPTLGNGVEDEIAVTIPDDTDYGDYRVQTRETGESSWSSSAAGWNEQVLASDSDTSGTVSTTVTGRDDGEEYEVRARTETEHVTGAWTTPVSITTVFPAATNLSVDSVTETAADLSWQDNADNEDGMDVERAKWYDDIEEWTSWRTIEAGLAPNTTTYSDTTPQPGTTYRWRIRAFTEHTQSYSTSVAETTTDSGVRTTNVPTSGWYVEVDHPDVAAPITPSVLEGAQRRPTVNGLPTVEIPVPYHEKWHTDAFNQASIRVWQDGDRLPIEELDHREMETRQGTKRTILTGVGGVQLRNRVEKEVEFEDAHIVAKDIANLASSYTLNVDDPANSVTEDSEIAAMDSTQDWQGFIPSSERVPNAPAEVDSGVLKGTKTAQFVSAEDATRKGNATNAFNSHYEGGEAINIEQIYDGITADVSFDHDIPSGSVGFAFRPDWANDTHPAIKWTVKGESAFLAQTDQDFTNKELPRWFTGSISDGISAGETVTIDYELTDSGTSKNGEFQASVGNFADIYTPTLSDSRETENVSGIDFDSGSYTEGTDYEVDYGNADIKALSGGDLNDGETYSISYTAGSDVSGDEDPISIDCFCVYDQRHTIAVQQDSLSNGGALSWPNEGPDSLPVETQDFETPFQVVGGRVEAQLNDTQNNQAIQVSQDQGSTWHPQDGTENNTQTVEHDWASGTPQIRARFRLSYFDDGSSGTSLGGIQDVDGATVFADVDDTPTLANRAFDGRAIDLLQRIAEDRNFVFEIRAIDDDTLSVEWAQPGQRSSDVDPDVAAFNVDRQTEDLVEQMTVFGSPQWRRGEEPDKNDTGLPHDQWVGLENTNLVELSESVVDASGGGNDGTQYTRGEDYEMRYLSGEIRSLSTGSIPDNTAVAVDYQYRTQGTYPDDSEVSDPREDVATIIGLGSSRVCEQAAFYIVDRANEPIWEAAMTVARGEVGWSVIDEINPPDAPTQDTALQTRAIETSDQSIEIRLASRRTTGEIIDDLRQRMSQLSERS